MLMAKKNIVKSGLVLWLEGKDFTNTPQTTSWRDRSGLGNNGTPINMAYTTSSGSNGVGGVTFDGVDDYVKVNNFDFNSSQITVEFWVKIETLTGRNYAFDTNTERDPLMKWKDGDTTVITWGLGAASYSRYTQGNKVGTFTHYAQTYDGTTEKLYINGDEVDSHTGSEAINFEELWIGEYNGNGYSLEGGIDDFRIYNQALTDSEIRQNYNASR